ncbi:hypothetical protein N1851_008284 [Merluccius polli]|uniref:Reverse transcriptase n=1 Tax=Merluccius polli TaxID=89951 RepID=A0AA47N2P2_MERPO|nr:hypothetical protein N1851_008284 [Merluccius polli]
MDLRKLIDYRLELIKKTQVEYRGQLTKSGVTTPPIRAFMDDLTMTTTSAPGSRWILKGLEELITWARMSFKPVKSRSLVLKKGKSFIDHSDTFDQRETSEESLGKVFDCSLRDMASIQATNQELKAWLVAVDMSGLLGKFKAWIYQHGILPRILSSRFLRKWSGLPRSLSNITLYRKNNMLKLPISSLNDEFMVTCTREVLQNQESSDLKISQVTTGRKWKAAAACGLGSCTKPYCDKAKRKDMRAMIQEELRVSTTGSS